MVEHVFNPSTCDVEAGRSLEVQSQAGLYCYLVPGQTGLYRETLS